MADYDNTNKGVAFKNDYKTEEKHPYYKGKGNFNGQDFEFGIWIKEGERGKFLTFAFSEPYVKEDSGRDSQAWQEAREKLKKDEVVEVTDDPIDLSEIPF